MTDQDRMRAEMRAFVTELRAKRLGWASGDKIRRAHKLEQQLQRAKAEYHAAREALDYIKKASGERGLPVPVTGSSQDPAVPPTSRPESKHPAQQTRPAGHSGGPPHRAGVLTMLKVPAPPPPSGRVAQSPHRAPVTGGRAATSVRQSQGR